MLLQAISGLLVHFMSIVNRKIEEDTMMISEIQDDNDDDMTMYCITRNMKRVVGSVQRSADYYQV